MPLFLGVRTLDSVQSGPSLAVKVLFRIYMYKCHCNHWIMTKPSNGQQKIQRLKSPWEASVRVACVSSVTAF